MMMPDIIMMGQKDIIQNLEAQYMITDFNYPIKMIMAPIVRESDGLASSSRLERLSEFERKDARSIYESLKHIEEWVQQPNVPSVGDMKDYIRNRITEANGSVNYLVACCAVTLEELPNKLGKIPAVILYNQRSPSRYIGLSSLVDVAELQQSIYNELSEIEQLIRLTNHPSLVKTDSVEASAGAGSVVLLPDDLDPNLKPYQLQPSGASLDSVMNSIKEKVTLVSTSQTLVLVSQI